MSTQSVDEPAGRIRELMLVNLSRGFDVAPVRDARLAVLYTLVPAAVDRRPSG